MATLATRFARRCRSCKSVGRLATSNAGASVDCFRWRRDFFGNSQLLAWNSACASGGATGSETAGSSCDSTGDSTCESRGEFWATRQALRRGSQFRVIRLCSRLRAQMQARRFRVATSAEASSGSSKTAVAVSEPEFRPLHQLRIRRAARANSARRRRNLRGLQVQPRAKMRRSAREPWPEARCWAAWMSTRRLDRHRPLAARRRCAEGVRDCP